MDEQKIEKTLEVVADAAIEASKTAKSKPWYKSKIIWAQVVGAALELINVWQPLVPPGAPALAVNAITIGLRLTSNTILKG